MAKGDFIFGGIDTETLSSAELTSAEHESDENVAGLTVVQLNVTIKLTREETRDGCICRPEITDYSLQANAFIGNDVRPGLPQKSVIAHELFHVREKKDRWEIYQRELNYLFTRAEYACNEDSRHQMMQDLYRWLARVLFADETEETRVRQYEQMIQRLINRIGESRMDPLLDDIFGENRLAENVDQVRPIPGAAVLGSRVIPTFVGSCSD